MCSDIIAYSIMPGKHCSIFGCIKKHSKGGDTSFHAFPKDRDIRSTLFIMLTIEVERLGPPSLRPLLYSFKFSCRRRKLSSTTERALKLRTEIRSTFRLFTLPLRNIRNVQLGNSFRNSWAAIFGHTRPLASLWPWKLHNYR